MLAKIKYRCVRYTRGADDNGISLQTVYVLQLSSGASSNTE